MSEHPNAKFHYANCGMRPTVARTGSPAVSCACFARAVAERDTALRVLGEVREWAGKSSRIKSLHARDKDGRITHFDTAAEARRFCAREVLTLLAILDKQGGAG